MSLLPLDFFLQNEELFKRHEQALPTNEMYRYFPPNDEIISLDSEPKKNYRFIFNGQPKTEYEQSKLNEYNQYELNNGKLNYPNFWLESDTMRLLQASEYDIEKTYKSIKDLIKFINNFPSSINNNIVQLLNSGYLYVYGRDHHFRPIIVVCFQEYLNILETKKYTFEDINTTIIYLMNYIVKYLLIPGQIENWITLIDLKGAGVSDISDFKKLLTTLNSYRGRVFKSFIVNVSGFLGFAVKTAVNLFGSSSAKKLKILDKKELYIIQEIISPDNLQKKYGGTAPDMVPGSNKLFPPVMPSMNYALNGERLNIVSEEAYKEMCLNSNPFKPYIISPKYQEKWDQEIRKKEEEKNEKLSNMITTNSISHVKEPDKKSYIKRTSFKEEKTQIKKKNDNIRKNSNKQYIMEFINEFGEVNILEMEEKKYYSKSVINHEKINLFFQKISKYRKKYL